MANKGWHSRGYLPHIDVPGLTQGITFRLWDSLPASVVEAWVDDPDALQSADKRARVEAYLNTGYGSCYLRDHRIAGLVERALWHFDGMRYRLVAWVIMPNHVHVVIETVEGYEMPAIVHSWKSYTASEANKLLQRRGKFWFREYYDRFIRDERHLATVIEYVHYNPVKAGLVAEPADWPFSSARYW